MSTHDSQATHGSCTMHYGKQGSLTLHEPLRSCLEFLDNVFVLTPIGSQMVIAVIGLNYLALSTSTLLPNCLPFFTDGVVFASFPIRTCTSWQRFSRSEPLRSNIEQDQQHTITATDTDRAVQIALFYQWALAKVRSHFMIVLTRHRGLRKPRINRRLRNRHNETEDEAGARKQTQIMLLPLLPLLLPVQPLSQASLSRNSDGSTHAALPVPRAGLRLLASCRRRKHHRRDCPPGTRFRRVVLRPGCDAAVPPT